MVHKFFICCGVFLCQHSVLHFKTLLKFLRIKNRSYIYNYICEFWGSGGTHSLAGEGAGGANSDEGTDTVVLYVYTVYTLWSPESKVFVASARVSSHRRKGVASHIIDIGLPSQQGEGGICTLHS
jgi:hypothetical protein